MTQTCCDILDITPVTPVVYQVRLKPQSPITFQAGQYLLVHMGDEDKRPFSIASAVYENDEIELHIGADKSNKYAFEVLELLQQRDNVEISGGFGEAYLRTTERPSILVAGGTGFSYTYAILKQALHDNPSADITLYWGSRQQSDFYFLDTLRKLESEHRHFTFVPVVEHADDSWKGRTGWVHKAVLADFPSLSGYHVYIAGRFEMAKTARDDFFAKGLTEEALYGDAYAFI
ncbi:NAD(P)H-flavin reductase [Alteromonas sediminis]|uniref:NAD(P)H-flavin reductase n=1 Tax=Alteromonas sediminis TaxID=2259342 RepID=A0A3N5XW44_9ALTE|nr:NAD(P)H-flavin reductase [Alteromonas sediminis]RPJ64792.1 NAD(P)H-flavin reductase [Alteromonas sediminis]